MLKKHYVNPKYEAVLEQAGVLNERAILEWECGQRIINRRRADVFRADMDGIGAVYVKRYFPKKNKFLGGFRNNQAFLEYRSSVAMATLGIPQAEPVQVASVRNRLGMTVCGIYIMGEVENAVSLDKILEQMDGDPDNKMLEAIVDELVRVLGRMHDGNFCHWDFKPRNLLLTQRPDGVAITPIDSRSGKRMSVLTRKAWMKRDYKFLLAQPLLKPFLEKRLCETRLMGTS